MRIGGEDQTTAAMEGWRCKSGRRAVAMQGGSLPPSLFMGMGGAIFLAFVVFEFVDHSVHVHK